MKIGKIGVVATLVGTKGVYRIYIGKQMAFSAQSLGLEYTLNADKVSYQVSGMGSCTDTEVVIPAEHKGFPVTEIGYRAFYNCDRFTSIVIPDSVTSIGYEAFYNCSDLTSVVIPDSVTTIGLYAFNNCSRLTSVVIGDSVTSIGSYAFRNCYSLISIEIPDSVTTIGGDAFSDCSSLTSVSIGDSVTTVGKGAFSYCDSLTEMTIPFVGATKDGTSNSYFGYIFGAWDYFGNATYVPTSLKKVTITSATSIGEYAFSRCSGLTSVTIPDSVTSIGNHAFYGCSGLTSISFTGTAAQWNAISKGSNWKYNVPAKEVVCKDGRVSI